MQNAPRGSLAPRTDRMWPSLGATPSILATVLLQENPENGKLPLTTKTKFPKLLQGDHGLLQDILEICNPGRWEGEANDAHPNPELTGLVTAPEAHSSLKPPVSNLFLPPLQDVQMAKLNQAGQRQLWGTREL